MGGFPVRGRTGTPGTGPGALAVLWAWCPRCVRQGGWPMELGPGLGAAEMHLHLPHQEDPAVSFVDFLCFSQVFHFTESRFTLIISILCLSWAYFAFPGFLRSGLECRPDFPSPTRVLPPGQHWSAGCARPPVGSARVSAASPSETSFEPPAGQLQVCWWFSECLGTFLWSPWCRLLV